MTTTNTATPPTATADLTPRQWGIFSLCESMGYPYATAAHVREIDAMAAAEVMELQGDMLDTLGEYPALTVEVQRRIEDAINPIIRRCVRVVMATNVTTLCFSEGRHATAD